MRNCAVMCPDKKYEWFKDNPDWRPADRILAKEVVEENWKEFSAIYDSANVSTTTSANFQFGLLHFGTLNCLCCLSDKNG